MDIIWPVNYTKFILTGFATFYSILFFGIYYYVNTIVYIFFYTRCTSKYCGYALSFIFLCSIIPACRWQTKIHTKKPSDLTCMTWTEPSQFFIISEWFQFFLKCIHKIYLQLTYMKINKIIITGYRCFYRKGIMSCYR